MGQKIHPLGLRLGITQKHRSKWFAQKKDYPRLILEDKLLRNYLFKTYASANIVDIVIHRRPKLKNLKTKQSIELLEIFIYTPFSGKIIDFQNQNESIEALRAKLEQLCQKKRAQANLPQLRLRVKVLKIQKVYSEASIIADFLIEKLEERIPFRQALKGILKRVIESKQLEGVKIQIAGRLNGAEIARTEWARDGRVPLQTLRADVNYSSKTAKTIYGILGIKVWAFKKEEI